jgi:hypothetical protein
MNGFDAAPSSSNASPAPAGRSIADRGRLAEGDLDAELVLER